MDIHNCETPVKSKKKSTGDVITIPATPFLKKIGYGTGKRVQQLIKEMCFIHVFVVGVAVYELKRSPYLSKLRSPWAIKKLVKKISRNSKENKKRLNVEAEVLRQLNHPNVVGFRGVFKGSDGEPCLAMEECDFSLGDAIEERQEKSAEPFSADRIEKVIVCKIFSTIHCLCILGGF